ncbi:putative RING-H2 finger protein ATL21B isoform X3 [Alnus glutinosa]|uniref:putative RING-H2 finger protein ATL21B isoform X3 n=1 Tax=Alnus glutinosa TaxID=3517 RepID=UPI002D77B7E6|nr:putative RING-H2 finger protein ATL21B isoform X3 [Alnus glutinosa]
MASFQVFFPTSFFLLLLFFFLPRIASNAIICKPSSCDGNQNVPVQFPFRLKGSQAPACGYDPGFDLSCDNKSQTILRLPKSGDFVVLHINYLYQLIYIADPDDCFPKRLIQNFTASGSPFQIDYLDSLTFFNCSSSNATIMFGYMVECLSSDDYIVQVIPTDYLDQVLPPVTCRANWTESFLSRRYPMVRLSWGKPRCGGCVARGGDCARENATSTDVGCFNVPSSGGLPRSAKYGIIIGVGIPGLLCIIGLSCYLCGRIRVYRRRHQANMELTSIISPQQQSVFAMGLDGPTIESYPKTLLGESRRLPKPSDNTCPICLSEYQPKEELRTIPECNHYFHANCIDEWLKLNGTCPLCRNSPDGSALVTPSSTSSSSLSLASL